jgi:hypothetical protein
MYGTFYHDWENRRGLPALDLVAEKAARIVTHPMTAIPEGWHSHYGEHGHEGCGCPKTCACRQKDSSMYGGSRKDKRLVNRPDRRLDHSSRMHSGRRLGDDRAGVRVNRTEMMGALSEDDALWLHSAFRTVLSRRGDSIGLPLRPHPKMVGWTATGSWRVGDMPPAPSMAFGRYTHVTPSGRQIRVTAAKCQRRLARLQKRLGRVQQRAASNPRAQRRLARLNKKITNTKAACSQAGYGGIDPYIRSDALGVPSTLSRAQFFDSVEAETALMEDELFDIMEENAEYGFHGLQHELGSRRAAMRAIAHDFDTASEYGADRQWTILSIKMLEEAPPSMNDVKEAATSFAIAALKSAPGLKASAFIDEAGGGIYIRIWPTIPSEHDDASLVESLSDDALLAAGRRHVLVQMTQQGPGITFRFVRMEQAQRARAWQYGAGTWGSTPIGGWGPWGDRVVADMFPEQFGAVGVPKGHPPSDLEYEVPEQWTTNLGGRVP